MRILLTLPLIFGISHCSKDETLSGHGAAGVTWQLTEIDGAPFAAMATITFPEEGVIAGEAPCNSYRGTQVQPYPWFEATQIAVTRRACPELALETKFLNTLGDMTLVEVVNETLLLTTPEGREMVFRAQN